MRHTARPPEKITHGRAVLASLTEERAGSKNCRRCVLAFYHLKTGRLHEPLQARDVRIHQCDSARARSSAVGVRGRRIESPSEMGSASSNCPRTTLPFAASACVGPYGDRQVEIELAEIVARKLYGDRSRRRTLEPSARLDVESVTELVSASTPQVDVVRSGLRPLHPFGVSLTATTSDAPSSRSPERPKAVVPVPRRGSGSSRARRVMAGVSQRLSRPTDRA